MNENDIATMTNEGLLHRRLEQTDVLSTLFFFAFGAMIVFVTCSMSQSSRRAELREQARREEQQREEMENTIKMLQSRRKHLRRIFKKQGLAKILAAANFKLVSGENSVDLEQGTTAPTNIAGDDEKNDSKGVTQSQNEMEIQSSNHDHSLTIRVLTSPQDSCTYPSVDKELEDSSSLEWGEVHFLRNNNTPMTIPILCSICLENYQEGETVVVSSNLSCTHGFHQDCILDHLVRHEQGSYPCPCCRQEFLPTETMMSDARKNQASASLELDTGNPSQD